jgi:hypothetical protein
MVPSYKHTDAEAHAICADLMRAALRGDTHEDRLPQSSIKALQVSLIVHRKAAIR